MFEVGEVVEWKNHTYCHTGVVMTPGKKFSLVYRCSMDEAEFLHDELGGYLEVVPTSTHLVDELNIHLLSNTQLKLAKRSE